jgi:hypothetical protein
MIEERNLIYFDPFYFKNGNTAKPKYFLILKQLSNKIIIASLPTRKDTVPSNEEVSFGCVELPDINFNCFVLQENMEVTECGKSLPEKTFLYGHQLDEHEIDLLKVLYPNEGCDYTIIGKMKSDIFENIIKCFKSSKTVKNKFKKVL